MNVHGYATRPKKRDVVAIVIVALSVVGIILVGVTVAMVGANRPISAKVLSINQVLRKPQVYLGHVVLLHGWIGTTPGYWNLCDAKETAKCSPVGLTDAPGSVLFLRPGQDRLMQTLRSIPVIGRFVPPPQTTSINPNTVYRIRLMALPPPCRRFCLYGELVDSVDLR